MSILIFYLNKKDFYKREGVENIHMPCIMFLFTIYESGITSKLILKWWWRLKLGNPLWKTVIKLT
jgi:hypothetical protein